MITLIGMGSGTPESLTARVAVCRCMPMSAY